MAPDPELENEDLAMDVHAQYGMALHNVQSFETSIISALKLFDQLNRTHLDEASLADLDSLLSKETLGMLLRRLRKRLILPNDLEYMLDHVVAERNYLVHHFFYDTTESMATARGCRHSIEYLRNVGGYFLDLCSMLDGLIRRLAQELGWSDEEFQREVSALRDALLARAKSAKKTTNGA